MAHDVWLRTNGYVQFLPGDETTFDGVVYPLIRADAPAVDSVLRRIICDIKVWVTIDDTAGGGPIAGWWAQEWITVGVGRDETPTSPLELNFGTGDPRITGTAMLAADSQAQETTIAGWRTASYSTQQAIDTHGQRRPITPGTTPVTAVDVLLQGSATSLADTFDWVVVYFAYVRSLWTVP